MTAPSFVKGCLKQKGQPHKTVYISSKHGNAYCCGCPYWALPLVQCKKHCCARWKCRPLDYTSVIPSNTTKSYTRQRMADNNKWIHRVLYKLNELFLNGSDFDDRRWEFDWDNSLKTSTNLDNVWNEDRALETLTKAGVIKSRSLENRYRSEQLKAFDAHGKDALVYGDWYNTDSAHREYEYERWIDGFNYKNFQRFCELHGFNPTNSGITCKLEISSGVTPIIHAQGARHSLLSLEAGSIPQAVVQYAAKKFDTEIPINELRQHINHVQLKNDNANLKQFFKNNIFSAEKVLGMFAQITPKTFLLKHEALLTSTEIASIERISTN